MNDEEWKGHRAFVIGGGSSLRSFDFSLLSSEKTIGLNKAYEKNPTICLFMDDRVISEFKDDIDLYTGEKLILGNTIHQAKTWSNSFSTGLYAGRGSGNAGLAGLSLAHILGADPVYLLGYDMMGAKGKTKNWHDGYPVHWLQDERVYYEYMKDIEAVSQFFTARIINLNPGSALRCFPKAHPSAVFPQANER